MTTFKFICIPKSTFRILRFLWGTLLKMKGVGRVDPPRATDTQGPSQTMVSLAVVAQLGSEASRSVCLAKSFWRPGYQGRKPHIFKKRVVCLPCLRRRQGQTTTCFWEMCGFWALVPQASKKHLTKKPLRDPLDWAQTLRVHRAWRRHQARVRGGRPVPKLARR